MWKTFPFKHFLHWEVHKTAQLHCVSPRANIVLRFLFMTLRPFESQQGVISCMNLWCMILQERVNFQNSYKSVSLCRCVHIVPLSGSEKWFLGINFTHTTMNSPVISSFHATVFVLPVLTDTINREQGKAIVTCRVKFQNIWNPLSIETAARPDPGSGGHFSQKFTISEHFFSSCVLTSVEMLWLPLTFQIKEHTLAG